MTLYWKDVNGRNWPVCSCLKEWLTAYQNELLRVGEIKHGLDLYQTIGDAAASAGYHAKGGNVDTGQTGTNEIRIARNMGGAASGRGPADGMTPHCHISLVGCPHMTSGPRWQVNEMNAGRNGLVNRARDRGPRDGVKFPLRTWQQGIAWAKARQAAAKPTPPKPATYYVTADRAFAHSSPQVDSPVVGSLGKGKSLQVVAVEKHNGGDWGYTLLDGKKRWWIMRLLSKTKPTDAKLTARIGQLNAPGYDKGLGNEDARARKIAAEAKSRNLDAFNLNEGESRVSDTQPSKWVALIAKYLGNDWGVIVPSGDPTSGSNENYQFYRKSKFPTHKKHPDFVVREGFPGRHLTPTTFSDALTGKTITIGATHLATGRAAGVVQGPVAFKHLASLATNGLWVGSCDANTEVNVAPVGSLNARDAARATSNRDMSTYGRYTDTKPTFKPEWIIDQFAVSDKFRVDGYTVIPDIDDAGNYNKPRISDHLFVIVKVTEL